MQRRANEALQTKQSELGPGISEIDAFRYLDPERYENEQRIFDRASQPLFLLGALPRPFGFKPAGKYLAAQREGETPRLFLNKCQHRAARIVAADTCQRVAACPYHGWTYDLTGRCVSVFGKDSGFADSAGLALSPVPSLASAGFLWAMPNEEEIAALADDFDALGIVSPTLVEEYRLPARFNWKLGVEAFLEVYHFKMAHRHTLPGLPSYNVALFDHAHGITRITIPMARVADATVAALQESCHFMYFVFPNQFFLVFRDHFGWLTIEPRGLSECALNYRGLSFQEAPGPALIEKIQGSVRFLRGVKSEDIAICEGVFANLRRGDKLRLTRYEPELARFHRRLDLAD